VLHFGVYAYQGFADYLHPDLQRMPLVGCLMNYSNYQVIEPMNYLTGGLTTKQIAHLKKKYLTSK